jgi:hypothetical protein
MIIKVISLHHVDYKGSQYSYKKFLKTFYKKLGINKSINIFASC